VLRFAPTAKRLGSALVISVFINFTLVASSVYSMQLYDRMLTGRNLGTLAIRRAMDLCRRHN
jgi:ABC-type protease/lipase transport system fused ATPase/permease subunit